MFLLSCLLASCASVLNRPYTSITVHTDRPAKVVGPVLSQSTIRNTATLVVPREPEPLPLRVVSDSSERQVVVHPFNSFSYYANLFCNGGIGMLVDKHHPRRYGYPRHIYLDASDTAKTYSRWA